MIAHQAIRKKEAEMQQQHFRTRNFEIYRHFPGFDSNMTEIYACLTSLFTWKKLIKNSTVLIHTDNAYVSWLINGLDVGNMLDLGPDEATSLKQELVTRMKLLLFEMAHQYSITFVSKVISSEENQAADCLSRFLEERFRRQLNEKFNRDVAPSRSNCFFIPLANDGPVADPSTWKTLNELRTFVANKKYLWTY